MVKKIKDSSIAQLVAQQTVNLLVVGSNPTGRAKIKEVR